MTIHKQPSRKMKAGIYLTALCILSLSIFLIYSRFEGNSNDITISIKDADDTYQFTASYNPATTGRVQHYINRCLAPNGLFQSESDYMDINTTLADKTFFYVKESPGKLKIRIDKRRNSTASYNRIKEMCEGLKRVIGSN